MTPSNGLSIIIPSRSNVTGLWATITACETLIEGAPHEYIAILNGQFLEESHILLQERSDVRLVHFHDPMPPPAARNLGAKHAIFPTLCFLDDHVIPTRSFFDWDIDAEVVHCSYKTYPRHELRYFHYKFNPECPVKGDYSAESIIKRHYQPYPCLSGPHGGFFVDRKYFLESGGYDDFWQGFGGEEAYFGLKANLAGKRVVCNPNALFYHFSCRSEVRGYDKTFNEYNFTEGLRRLKELGDLDALLHKFAHHKMEFMGYCHPDGTQTAVGFEGTDVRPLGEGEEW